MDSGGFDGYTVATEEPPEPLRLLIVVVVVTLTLLGPLTTLVFFTKDLESSSISNNGPQTTRTVTNSFTTSTGQRTTYVVSSEDGLSSLVSRNNNTTMDQQQRAQENMSALYGHTPPPHYDDDPSVTEHHTNRIQSAPPTSLLSSSHASSSWWKKPNYHQNEFWLAPDSAVSGAQTQPLPSPSVVDNFPSRAVLSEAAAGSMERDEWLQRRGRGPQQEEDGEAFVEEDDVFIRSSLPLHYQQHQPRRYYVSAYDQRTELSVMPPLDPNAVAPEDAADAHDLGKLVHYPHKPQSSRATYTSTTTLWDHILDVANPYFENRRIFSLALSSVMDVTDPLYRLVTAACLAWFMGTESMVAYLLVHVLLRVSGDVMGAIADVESSLVQDSILLGGEAGLVYAGQSMQLGLLWQVMAWILWWVLARFATRPVVVWLLADSVMADLAARYANVVVGDYLLRAISKSLFLPLQMMNQGEFEFAMIELGGACVVVAAVILMGWQQNGVQDLWLVGVIQVIAGVSVLISKLGYATTGGLMAPYAKGFFASVTLFVSPECMQSRDPLCIHTHNHSSVWPL